MNGDLPLPEADAVLGLELDHEAEDTLGGHVVSRLGRLPEKGDVVVIEGYRLTVLQVDQHRIARLRAELVEPPNPLQDEDAEEAEPA